MRYKDIKNLTITSTISCAKLRLLIICAVEVKSRYPVDTCVYC